jgi:hypothetical protein
VQLPSTLVTALLLFLAPFTAGAQNSGSRTGGAQPVGRLIAEFSNLTDLQQEEWNSDHEWQYTVEGSGKVEEVGETNFMSQDDSFPYQVTVELSSGKRAVVYYPEKERDYVLGLDIGSRLDFSDKLKRIKDWGLWTTAYVKTSDAEPRGSNASGEDSLNPETRAFLNDLKSDINAEEILGLEEMVYDDDNVTRVFVLYREDDSDVGAAVYNTTEGRIRGMPLRFESLDNLVEVRFERAN